MPKNEKRITIFAVMRDDNLLEHLQTFLTPRRQELFVKVLDKRTNHFTVVTEDVYQMHNTSAVIRSCDVFGVQNVHIVEERNAKRIDREIAMGAQKWVSINRHDSVCEAMTNLRNRGYQIVATTPYGNAQELHEFDITKPSAFFFGTEKDGLSQEVLDEADAFVKIPMAGFTESLNISVSAAIILQHVTTKLKKTNIDWKLTEEERFDTKLQWTKNTIKSIDQIVERFYEE